MKINNVIIPCRDSPANTDRWDIHIEDCKIRQIWSSKHVTDEPPKLLLPALCHPHIHLDKPFILTCNRPTSKIYPDYSDLAPETGSFSEALSNTSLAKERYNEEDLYLRGSQLLATSYEQGVTSLRAFVEVDHVTGALPLTTAIRLKSDFSHLLEIQICVFAQDPLFSTTHGGANRTIISSLLEDYAASIQVLGTTPYVEDSREAALRNIEWAITTAIHYGFHLDFHLDYNLDPISSFNRPLTFSVIELLEKHGWLGRADASKTIVLGHCTQLTVLEDSNLRHLAETIIRSRLPIHFVGLPSSDMFMMGRPTSSTNKTQARLRGTLNVPSLIKDFGLSACIGVNNVGNAFTPYGSGDPLQMASWAVGIYQAGSVGDASTLYGCVSWLARKAIGLEEDIGDDKIGEGRSLKGMLLIGNNEHINLPSTDGGPELKIPARQRTSFKDIVWDPPEAKLRSIMR
ncbi:Metallo-dependent hydrolase [Hypomontagnella submonticulosa]|nr:Metallo-dependent hydrolase [Hypomontagnella submonticulosa]